MKPAVRIMMATYNGGQFLDEQILSIINQTYENWTLIVQDDGSTDNTIELLEKYSETDSRIELRNSPESNHGAFYNFHSIANQEKTSGRSYDYYMFADQDDIWNLDKIDVMVSEMEKADNTIPVLLYGDMCVINERGDITINSIVEEQSLQYKNAESLFFSHSIFGCNVIMNNKAFFSVPVIDTSKEIVSILSHDNLYAKFAGILGRVSYLDIVLMTYRRHGDNATSKQEYGFAISRIIRRALNLNDLAKDHARNYSHSLETIRLLRSDTNLSTECNKKLNDIEEALLSSGIKSISIMKRYNVDLGNAIKNISRRSILFLGLHKKYLYIYS